MHDFDERDLVAFAERAGFAEVHCELRIDVAPTDPFPHWDALEAAERERFRAHMRAGAEEGRGVERQAVAYLWAVER